MRRTPLLLSCFALFSAALMVADDFQGMVHMKVTSDGKSTEMDYETKPGLVKYSMPNGAGAAVIDMNKQQMTIIMTQQHMYMVRPMPQSQQVASAAQPAAQTTAPHPSADLVDTHTTETILGHKCNKYTITSANGHVVELWAASDLGNFMGFGAGGSPMGGGRQSAASTSWAKAVAGRGFFPMRVVDTVGGAEKTRMEVTSIQKQDLADSEFAPPAGFQALDMAGMLGGMGRGQ